MDKNKKLFFTALFLLFFLNLFFFNYQNARAANSTDLISVPIPGLKFNEITTKPAESDGQQNLPTGYVKEIAEIPWIADYTLGIYNYALGFAALLATFTLIYGGFYYLTAGLKPENANKGKKAIFSALAGLTLLLGSYTVLRLINPDLVNLKVISIPIIEKQELPGENDYSAVYTSGVLPEDIVSIEVETTSGNKTIRVNKSIQNNVKNAFQQLNNIEFNVVIINDYRPESQFCHGKGLAVDINPTQNYCINCYNQENARVGSFYRPNTSVEPTNDPKSLTQAAVEIMKANGFCWGGDWKGFKDYMHFSHNSCSVGECAANGKFDFSKTVQQNQEALGLPYP